MSKPTAAPVRPDADEGSVTPEVEAELRRRLETFDEDVRAARPWQDVLADLKARRFSTTSDLAPLTVPPLSGDIQRHRLRRSPSPQPASAAIRGSRTRAVAKAALHASLVGRRTIDLHTRILCKH
jgi:hypothetical protein